MPSSRLERHLPWLLLIGGAIGFVASFTLLVEKIALLKDPSYVPTCSINPILSCGSIMSTDQAELFGFPNPILGVAGFAVVVTAGVALVGGTQFPAWFWWGLQGGVTAGAVLVHWLIFQSLYRIGALCPYCMVVWAVTIPLLWYVSLRNLGGRGIPSRLGEYHGVVLTAWFLVIAGLITKRFWDYWSTLLS